MYIDGAEVGRINFTGAAETFDAFTPGNVNGDETAYTNIPLSIASLAPGAHTFAMSVHQSNSGSSDLSFNLQLNRLGTPKFGTIRPNAVTHLSEPPLAAIDYLRGTNPPGTELGFTTS